MDFIRSVVTVVSLVCLGLGMSACSKVKFSTKDFVSKSNVFGDNNGDGTSSTEDPRPYDGGDDPSNGIPEVHVEVHRDCSNNDTKESGNVLEATTVSLLIYDQSNKLVCQSDKNYRSAFLNFNKFTVDIPCEISKNGKFNFRFFDLDTSTSNDLGSFRVTRKNGLWEQGLNKMEITYGANYKKNGDRDYPESLGFMGCEEFSSPLVVQLRDDRPLKLSSPTDGILFDILGSRGGHLERQISWPVDDTIAFIALPDKNGLVHSVDQLFGDNTKGPDGLFADNGYHALAKFDLNGDKRIDRKDAVYSELRLFVDSNRDGVSQASELSTLADHNIRSIDLEYDPHYSESDIYGNKILFKSVAETNDDDLLLVFDIWFRHID